MNPVRLIALLLVSLISVFSFLPPTALSKEATSKTALLAGGCFWCLEADLEKVAGVQQAVSGYAGGEKLNPTYKEVTQGTTGHYEVVEVTYDPSVISYEKLLDSFWRNIDPLDPLGQFCDKGPQYRSAIFVSSQEERRIAEASLAKIREKLGKEIHTEILPAGVFYKAEDYHQNYAKRNPFRYRAYRWGCRRDKRLQAVWGEK